MIEANWGPDFADPSTYTGPFTEGGTYNKPELAEGYNGEYQKLVDAAEAEVAPEKRYELFAKAEAFLIEEAFVIPYAVGGGGYVASKLNPFESQYSPFMRESKLLKVTEGIFAASAFLLKLSVRSAEGKAMSAAAAAAIILFAFIINSFGILPVSVVFLTCFDPCFLQGISHLHIKKIMIQNVLIAAFIGE